MKSQLSTPPKVDRLEFLRVSFRARAIVLTERPPSIVQRMIGSWSQAGMWKGANFRTVLAEHGASDYRVGVVRALIESSPQAAAMQQAVMGPDKAINDMTARALVRVLLDDLHVLRLRQVWKATAERLGRRSITIYDPDPEEKKAANAAKAANVARDSAAGAADAQQQQQQQQREAGQGTASSI